MVPKEGIIDNDEWRALVQWQDERMEYRMRKRLRCTDVYERSTSSSPDVYAEFLEQHRKSKVKPQDSTLDEELKDSNFLTTEKPDEPKGDNSPEYSDKRYNSGEIYESGKRYESDSDEIEYGPQPLQLLPNLEKKPNYGADLLPGEGAAIAQYVQEGKRIPRRGEVGLSSEEIEQFERLGYVMSGSRHRAMNAVRIRKETQVLNAEQERADFMKKYMNRVNRENNIVTHFKEVLSKLDFMRVENSLCREAK